MKAIVEYAIRPQESDFLLVPMGNGDVAKIHPYPLRVSREIRTRDRGYTKRGGTVYGLASDEEFNILDSLSTVNLPLRHVRLAENKAAAYSNEGQAYKQNVLMVWWSRTGQLIRLSGDTALREALALPISPSASAKGQLITRDSRLPNGYNTKEIVVPSKTGFFTTISGDMPVDGDISVMKPDAEEIMHWNGIYPDENGIATVWCRWNSKLGGLYVVGDRLLVGATDGALSIAADAPLDK